MQDTAFYFSRYELSSTTELMARAWLRAGAWRARARRGSAALATAAMAQKKTDPPLGPPYCRAVSNHEGFQRALVGSIQAAARLGPGVPRATTSLFWLSGWDLNPSSDPWDASLPTDRQREGRLAQASHAASRSRGLPKHPAIRCRANTVSSYLPSESATPVDAQ